MSERDRKRDEIAELGASSGDESSVFERPTLPAPPPAGLWNEVTPTVPVHLQVAEQAAVRTALGIAARADERVAVTDGVDDAGALAAAELVSQDDIETLRPPPAMEWPQLLSLSMPPDQLELASPQPDAAGPSLAPSVRKPQPPEERRALRWVLPTSALLLLLAGVIGIGLRPTPSSSAVPQRVAAASPQPRLLAAQPLPTTVPPPTVVPEVLAPGALGLKVSTRGAKAAKRPTRSRADLPAEPSRDEIVHAVNALRPRIEVCTGGRAGVVELDLRIADTGRFQHALVGGDFVGAQGSCIARALRAGKVKPFAKDNVRALYRMSL